MTLNSCWSRLEMNSSFLPRTNLENWCGQSHLIRKLVRLVIQLWIDNNVLQTVRDIEIVVEHYNNKMCMLFNNGLLPLHMPTYIRTYIHTQLMTWCGDTQGNSSMLLLSHIKVQTATKSRLLCQPADRTLNNCIKLWLNTAHCHGRLHKNKPASQLCWWSQSQMHMSSAVTKGKRRDGEKGGNASLMWCFRDESDKNCSKHFSPITNNYLIIVVIDVG